MTTQRALKHDRATTSKTAPNSVSGLSKRHLELVRRACDHIDARDGQGVTLASLAETLGLSPWHLQRLFKRAMGVSPRDYAEARRSRRFRAELRTGESVAGATYGAGYGSSSRVYGDSQRRLGMTPASYAKGGKGARIAYATVDSALGRLLVAATARGICFVSLGDADAPLVAALEAEFPEAEVIVRDEDAIAPALDELLAHLEGKTPHLSLPLDVRATAFQRRVWQELMAIPPSETRSYSEIAAALGLPQGQRAVGRACATNPVAIVVPCHRALRADGTLGGYRWGLDRKAALLRREAGREPE
ncbi:MAG: methylated-DNA--[protein]-cysteine S-methyltransferase [Proteobacteria bacterium]|nr:methylated-DNA--[protein]-cysteine S-methyltransferase [Pseudomonadota bacterium]